MPWKYKPTVELERKIDTLQMQLLRANAESRLKSIAIEGLETLVCERNQRIDPLTATTFGGKPCRR